MVIVLGKVIAVNEKVMVVVERPELAVDDVEMFVGEVICYQVDLFLILQQLQHLWTRPLS